MSSQKLSGVQPPPSRYKRRGVKNRLQAATTAAQKPNKDKPSSKTTVPPIISELVKPEDILALADQLEGGTIIEKAKSSARLKQIRLDELNDDQLEVYAENCLLVALMSHDLPAEEAVRRLGFTRTPRTARNLYRKYKQDGFKGLIDRRWLRETEATVFTTDVKLRTLYWFFSRPAAGPRAIWKKVCEECEEGKEPSETVVKTYLSNLDEGLKLFRLGKVGIRKWEQTACPVIRYENTTYANELWQGDHGPLRIWVKVKVNGVWKPFKTYLTVIIDAHTRPVMGHVVSTKYPDSWTIALAFRRAIIPKENRNCIVCGIPSYFESDRGSDFISYAIAATLSGLGAIPLPDPPHYPNDKGKVEAMIKTIDLGCLRILPGHMDDVGCTEGAALKRVHELLTLPQLDNEIARWIDKDYHQRVHSETGRAPVEYWEDTVRLRLPESEDELNLLLLKYDKSCKVRNTGIKFTLQGVRHRFWSPELADYFKREVRLRYNPEDMDSVLVYCAATGEFLCEAFDMHSDTPRYTIEDIKRTRSQYRRGVLERIRGYMREVYQNDRNATARAERAEARQLAQTIAAEEEDSLISDSDTENSEDVQDLFALFKKQDIG